MELTAIQKLRIEIKWLKVEIKHKEMLIKKLKKK